MHPDLRGYRTFQALILGALGVFLLGLIGDSGILRYIHQRFLVLVLAGGLVLLLLAQVVLQSRPAVEKPGEFDPEGIDPGGIDHGEHDHPHEHRRGWHLWL